MPAARHAVPIIVLIASGWTTTYAQEPLTGERHLRSVGVYISEDAIDVEYLQERDVSQVGRTQLSASAFFNETRDLIAMGSALMIIGEPQAFQRFSLRAGPRVYAGFLNSENEDIFGIGIGGEARYVLGPEFGGSVVLELFYAPDILVFGNADGVRDTTLRFEAGMPQNVAREGRTSLFVGYRNLEFDMAFNRQVDDNVHIGFRHVF